MSDERLEALYRRAMAHRAQEPGGCGVSLEIMVDVVEGRLPDAEHREALGAIMSDPRCRREFDLLRAAATRPVAGSRRGRVAWPTRIAAGIALALGTGAILYLQRASVGVDPTRDPGAASVELVAPAEGDHPGSDLEFSWRSVPGAVRYDLSLVTAGGRAVYSATGADTSLVLPDSVRPGPSEDLRWWVEATTEDGAQVRAPLRRLRIISP